MIGHLLQRRMALVVSAEALPDGDVMAVLMDPEGMSFGLMQSG